MVSVIVPTTGVEPDVNCIKQELQGIEHEVIVVYDRTKRGKGWALQEGFKRSKGEKIVWLDADLQIHPRHLKDYLTLNVDVVVASKLHPMSQVNYGWLRKKVTWLSTLIQRVLFNLPLRDTQTGLKVFRRKVLNREWKVKGYGFDLEVLTYAYHKGYTIVEMPVTITESKDSTVNLSGCIKTLYEILWLKWGMMRRCYYGNTKRI